MYQGIAKRMGLPDCVDWKRYWRYFEDKSFESVPESSLDEPTIQVQAQDVVTRYLLTHKSERELVSILFDPRFYCDGFAACATVTRAAAILALKMKKGRVQDSLDTTGWTLEDYGHCRAATKVRRDQKHLLETHEDQPWGNWKYNQRCRKQWMTRARRFAHKACKPLDYWGWKALEDSSDFHASVSQFVGDGESFKPLNGGSCEETDLFYTNEETILMLDAAQEDAMDDHVASLTPGEFGLTDAETDAYEQEWAMDWDRPDIDTADIRSWDEITPSRWSHNNLDWNSISAEGLLKRYGIYWKEPTCGCCGPHWCQDGRGMMQVRRGDDWQERWSSWNDLYMDRQDEPQFFKWLMAWKHHADIELSFSERYC